MAVERILDLTSKKTKVMLIKMNPELINLLDREIKKDGIPSRTVFFERCALMYLEKKGVLK